VGQHFQIFALLHFDVSQVDLDTDGGAKVSPPQPAAEVIPAEVPLAVVPLGTGSGVPPGAVSLESELTVELTIDGYEPHVHATFVAYIFILFICRCGAVLPIRRRDTQAYQAVPSSGFATPHHLLQQQQSLRSTSALDL
jgi:hypothetical protein